MNCNDDYRKLAENYFDFLASNFPVMCASDEFDFLPRAENAAQHYNRLDKFDSNAIEESIDILKSYRKQFEAANIQEGDLDRFIDLKLLQANAAGVLIELDTKRSWQYNPLMYLKIGFIGLDHALIKPAREPKEIHERALARLSSIPDILKNGMNNIQSVPETYYQASLLMTEDCQQYLSELGNNLSQTFGYYQNMAEVSLNKAAVSLEDFNRFLKSKTPEPDKRFAFSTLEASLKDHFLASHSPEDIFEIAKEEWQEILEQLKNLQSRIDVNKTWEQLYHAYRPTQTAENQIIALYGAEINRLRTFFAKKGFSEKLLSSPLEIIYTPTYLKSVRSSASFAAAFSRDSREKSYFYISTQFPQYNNKKTDHHLQRRLNREYKMLTAHETIPGHHFLDSFRSKLDNPIRRQIESPLFYEGWASYAESMLIEYGYLKDPLEKLVSLKRELWRSARCQIDVGFTIRMLSENQAVDLLTTCGFAPEEASRQLDRFRLNPGYQLSYCYGSHEFKQIKKKYGDRLEGRDFYSFLLQGGELPFHLIERRFEKRFHEE